jgi:isopentenyl-diphosphate Delta-isomerase
MDREGLLVELVDGAGNPIGTGTVAQAHTAPGQLHRAFSVLLYDEGGRTLLQRRAPGKTRFASRWSNACCGHPAPGQDVAAAATDRLAAELGLAATLDEVGVFSYRAGDPATGRVEHEWDHVLVGRVRGEVTLAPDPAEVSEYAWVAPHRLDAALAADPDAYTPWLPGVLRLASRDQGERRRG